MSLHTHRQGLAVLCPHPACPGGCPSDQDTLQACQKCPKASRAVLTSGTDEANSCESIFGQDSGETPNGAGSPSSCSPHTFFQVPDTTVHPDTAFSSSRLSSPFPKTNLQPNTSRAHLCALPRSVHRQLFFLYTVRIFHLENRFSWPGRTSGPSPAGVFSLAFTHTPGGPASTSRG